MTEVRSVWVRESQGISSHGMLWIWHYWTCTGQDVRIMPIMDALENQEIIWFQPNWAHTLTQEVIFTPIIFHTITSLWPYLSSEIGLQVFSLVSLFDFSPPRYDTKIVPFSVSFSNWMENKIKLFFYSRKCRRWPQDRHSKNGHKKEKTRMHTYWPSD